MCACLFFYASILLTGGLETLSSVWDTCICINTSKAETDSPGLGCHFYIEVVYIAPHVFSMTCLQAKLPSTSCPQYTKRLRGPCETACPQRPRLSCVSASQVGPSVAVVAHGIQLWKAQQLQNIAPLGLPQGLRKD